MRIFIIRHGESEADLLHVHEGRADYELTEKGRAQAKAMAKAMAPAITPAIAPAMASTISRTASNGYSSVKIYTSPLKRARQTAACLCGECGVLAEMENDLMEFNNGLLAGLDACTADDLYPEIRGLPPHESAYKQESRLEFRFRAERMLSKILSENGENDVVAVVTHGGMINQLYQAFLKLPMDSGMSFPTGDTGIHEWVVKNGCRYVARSNDTAHLAQLSVAEKEPYSACAGM